MNVNRYSPDDRGLNRISNYGQYPINSPPVQLNQIIQSNEDKALEDDFTKTTLKIFKFGTEKKQAEKNQQKTSTWLDYYV